MNAQLVLAAAGSGSPHRLLLPDQASDPLELVRQLLGDAELQAPSTAVGALRLECGQRRLGASCLAAISSRLAEAELGRSRWWPPIRSPGWRRRPSVWNGSLPTICRLSELSKPRNSTYQTSQTSQIS